MAPNPVPTWLDEHLVCVECGSSPLTRDDEKFTCNSCDSEFPVVNRVPLFLRSDEMTDTAASIAAYLGGLDPQAVQRAFGTALRYRLRDPELRGEFSQIVERYPLPPEEAQPPQSLDAHEFELVTHYFYPQFAAGLGAYRSFRIRSNVSYPLSSAGEKPFNVSYWLTDESGETIEGARSQFPIPLEPGRELTVPVLIVSPEKPGIYKITVQIVQEFVGWRADCPLYEGEITVVDRLPARDEMITPPHTGSFDFNEDIASSGRAYTLAVEIVRREAKKSDLTVLEIACGNDPQVLRFYQANSRVVACDVSFPQAQLGSLVNLHRGDVPADMYCFVAADVFSAPFRPGSFDIIVVCAALHHFRDTAVALDKLRRLLTPCGKIVLLREPGKVCANDPTYIRELENGFNEQQFEIVEYDVMFERSKLLPIYEQLDFECSYKAILTANS